LDDCFYVVHSIDNRGLWPEVLSGTMLKLTKDYWQECSVLISKTYMPFG